MRRWLVRLLVLVVVLAAAFLVAVQFYSPEAQRVALERRLTDAFGAPAHVGRLRITLWGGIGVEARDVTVALEPSFGDGAFLDIESVRANVSLWAFVTSHDAGVRAITVLRPKVRLVKRGDGVWNWSTAGAADSPSAMATAPTFARAAAALQGAGNPAAAGTGLRLESIDVEQATMTTVDLTQTPPRETEYRGLSLTVLLNGDATVRNVTGRLAGDSAASGGEPLDVDLPFALRLSRAESAARWRAEGTVTNGRLATRNTRFDEIVATGSLDEREQLSVSSLHCRFAGGLLTGSAVVDLATTANRFSIQGSIADLDLARALAPRPDLAGAVQGTAAATFSVTGDLGSFDETLQSLDGSGTAEIANPAFLKVNLLAEIATKTHLSLLDFSESDTMADRMVGGFRLERGAVRLIDATVSRVSGCVNVRVDSGRIGLVQPATVDVTGRATILPEVAQRVRSDSPGAAFVISVLTRRGGLTVPLVVRGDIGSPSVEMDWTALGGSLLFGAAAAR